MRCSLFFPLYKRAAFHSSLEEPYPFPLLTMSLPSLVRAFRTFPNRTRVGTVCQRQKKTSLIRMAEWQSRFPVVRTAHMDRRGLLFEDNRESLSSRYNLTAQREETFQRGPSLLPLREDPSSRLSRFLSSRSFNTRSSFQPLCLKKEIADCYVTRSLRFTRRVIVLRSFNGCI